eukprot:UN13634
MSSHNRMTLRGFDNFLFFLDFLIFVCLIPRDTYSISNKS